MDSGASGPKEFNDSAELVGVSGEDAVAETSGDHDEVRVDNISGPGEREKSAKRSAIVERVDRDGLQKHGEPCLGNAVSPHLGDNRMGGV